MNPRNIPMIVAHKGASAYQTGNTEAAFNLAVQQRADWIELDVQSTADGEIVVYDKWFVGDGTQRLAVVELPLTELRSIQAGMGQHPVLTLAEAVRIVRNAEIEILVELKNSMLRQPQDLGRRVAELLYRENFVDRSAVFSFDHVLISAIGHGFGIRKGLLYVGRLIGLETTLRTTGAEFVETRNDFLDQTMVEQLHASNRRVCGWATDDPEELCRLRELGVDMVTTNAPDAARAALTG